MTTPELQGTVDVQATRVVALRSGTVLEVMAADASSAYGLLPSMLFLDELCQWPKTANAKEFYVALTSALPKVPGSRLVVMTTAGDPAHWSKKIYDQACGCPKPLHKSCDVLIFVEEAADVVVSLDLA